MAGQHRARHGADHEAADGGDPGQHSGSQPGRRRKLRRGFAVVLVIAIALVAAAGLATRWRHDHTAAGKARCRGSVALPIVAAPTIASALSAVVSDWSTSQPAVGGACIRPTVASQDSDTAENAIIRSSHPTLWIPESGVWRTRLVTDAPSLATSASLGPSAATSPLVIASTPGHASAWTATAKAGWGAVLTGKSPVGIPDPAHNAEGAVTLVRLAAALGTSADATAALAGTVMRLGNAMVADSARGFRNLKAYPAAAPAFVTSEQQLVLANRGVPTAVATAVYPTGEGFTLDYPLVTINRSADPAFAGAARAFADQLRGPAARRALAARSLRDASGDPLGAQAGSPSGGRLVAPAPPPAPQALARVMQIWAKMQRPVAMLGVFDVSGSMSDDGGNGQSKIAIAAQATLMVMSLIPDSWSAGIWSFSTKPPPAASWTQLVPLVPLKSQRPALEAAAQALPNSVGGDTPLYATTLAAFENVTKNYDPKKLNAVILLTDGSNVDPAGIDLPTLIAKLKQEFNPDRPVNIQTMAFGKDADVAALRQISAATRGATWVVRNPTDLRAVMLKVLLTKP